LARKADQNGDTTEGRTARASGFGRLLLTRGLPGSVAVVAALTIPEFSVGAGDLDGNKPRPNPPEPRAKEGIGLSKPVPNAASAPFAGVRYGGLLAIREASQAPSASPNNEVMTTLPSRPPEAEAAAAITPTIRHATPLGRNANAKPALSDPLDEAATYAASLLDTIAVQPGVLAASLPDIPPPLSEKPAAIDMAASYAAMAIERFAEGAASELELVAEWEPQADLDPDWVGSAHDEADLALPGTPMGVSGDAGLVSPLSLPEPEVEAFTSPEPQPEVALLGSAATAIAVLSAADQPSPVVPMQTTRAPEALASVPPTTGLAAVPKPVTSAPPGLSTSVPAVRDASAGLAFDITSQLVTRVDGKAAGKVDFRQTTTGLSVRLGSIVSVLSDRYDPGEVARITTSAASNAYVSLADLQAQGIPISYDPVYDEFNIGQTDTRPKAARKVHIDQISAPERGAGTAAIDQVRR
jgi:hypothetical protein